MSSINLFDKDNFFTHKSTLANNHTIKINEIEFKEGDINTIYYPTGIGGTFFCYRIIENIDNCLIINTSNDMFNVPLLKNKEYICNSSLEEIIKILQVVIFSGIKYVLIDKVSSIICKKEYEDDFYSVNNTHPSTVVNSLMKHLKFFSIKDKVTFFLTMPDNNMINKSNKILLDKSNNIYHIKKEKNLYQYGECIGYKVSINNTLHQKLIFQI